MSKTLEAAKTAIKECMGIKDGEKFLILTDAGRLELAAVFAEAGRSLGYNTVLVCGPEQISGEMPDLCAAALERADAAMMITTGSFTHTKVRGEATKRGCRIASMPTITEEVVNTALNADYAEVERIGSILAQKLTEARQIRITTKAGTDLNLYCEGRTGIADTGKLIMTGAFGNLPAGEAMVAPIETKGDGILVVDGVISDFAVMESPLILTFKNGTIVNVSGDKAEEFEKFVSQFEVTARNVCEFGIGTNPKCALIGNPLTDEKVFGTIHIACGNNLFMGGQQDCDMHYDMIIAGPTVYLDGECIIKDGKHIY